MPQALSLSQEASVAHVRVGDAVQVIGYSGISWVVQVNRSQAKNATALATLLFIHNGRARTEHWFENYLRLVVPVHDRPVCKWRTYKHNQLVVTASGDVRRVLWEETREVLLSSDSGYRAAWWRKSYVISADFDKWTAETWKVVGCIKPDLYTKVKKLLAAKKRKKVRRTRD